MRVTLPGQPPHSRTSWIPPLLQLVAVAAIAGGALWAVGKASTVRATDVWAYNALGAVLGLAAALLFPFALAALVSTWRHRRREDARR